MNADEGAPVTADIAVNESQMMLAIELRLIKIQVEITVVRRHFNDFNPLNELFTCAAILNQICDGADL
jgi:hypothetical protein